MNKIIIKACGKWILAGEYAVLKGHPALAFPLPSQFMELHFSQTKEKKLHIQISTDKDSENLQIFLESTLQKALKMISRERWELNGLLKLKSFMFSGSGLGSSSVICVLVGKLFCSLKWLKEEKLFSFCYALEKLLQKGESSGLDIKVVLEEQAILYTNPDQWEVFQASWEPAIYLSYSGPGQNTDTNIQVVKNLWQKEPKKMESLNQKMQEAVLKAKDNLEQKIDKSFDDRLKALTEAFLMAEDCFLQWGLIGEDMQKYIQLLKKQGALAVKPTGSGGGGYVLSLWPTKIVPQAIKDELLYGF